MLNHLMLNNLKFLELTKKSELNPKNSKILLELYTCYVETSNSEKKIKKYIPLLSSLRSSRFP